MINLDLFLDILERNFPVLAREIGRDIEIMFLPPSLENPFGTDAKFKWKDREMVYHFNELDMKMDPNKVIDELTIMLADRFAPRPSRINHAAMPKNQVPTNNRTRIPNWKRLKSATELTISRP